jgi:hypothetical protein
MSLASHHTMTWSRARAGLDPSYCMVRAMPARLATTTGLPGCWGVRSSFWQRPLNGSDSKMAGFLLGLDIQPMEAKSVEALPDGEGWQFEPKWDGFRCLVFKGGGGVELRAKSGKSLSRYFPEMLEALRSAKADNFVLDGELTVPVGDTLSFAALQDRIHPAQSRIRKLASETPALLILFDCLATAPHGSLIDAPLARRRAALERVAAQLGHAHLTRLSPFTLQPEAARRWLENTRGGLDGVIAKRVDADWQPLRSKVVLEVRNDQVTGGRFRHNTKLLRWRPDKAPAQCSSEQLSSSFAPVGWQRRSCDFGAGETASRPVPLHRLEAEGQIILRPHCWRQFYRLPGSAQRRVLYVLLASDEASYMTGALLPVTGGGPML